MFLFRHNHRRSGNNSSTRCRLNHFISRALLPVDLSYQKIYVVFASAVCVFVCVFVCPAFMSIVCYEHRAARLVSTRLKTRAHTKKIYKLQNIGTMIDRFKFIALASHIISLIANVGGSLKRYIIIRLSSVSMFV